MMMTPMAEKSLTEWRAVNIRLFPAKFKSKQCNVSIIVCYAPAIDSSQERKDEYYEELQSVIDEIPESDRKIVICDFNGKVGRNNQGIENYIATNEERRRTLRNVSSYRDADIGSDHQLLCATLKLKQKTPNRMKDRIPRFGTTKLLEENSETFAIECRNRFAV
ncbi:craniofacial development protein 2-like [Palaemon carinicauda]|uniref:craniofacial development protein 2-like n=1 Tax=Palaemon carinicauda TaxID=392227 RepID=UPI0035B5F404